MSKATSNWRGTGYNYANWGRREVLDSDYAERVRWENERAEILCEMHEWIKNVREDLPALADAMTALLTGYDGELRWIDGKSPKLWEGDLACSRDVGKRASISDTDQYR